MFPLTVPSLLSVMPRAAPVAAAFVGPLNQVFARFGVTTPSRVAAFLAQAAHETRELSELREDLNYSAQALVKMWPNHFTASDAAAYARQPQRIANRAYADRLGNGPEESGDGWLYRGRGIFQLTGLAAYLQASRELYGDVDALLKDPDRVAREPGVACDTAGWFWDAHGLNTYADLGDFETITRRIAGGMTGYPDRLAYLVRAGVSMT